MNRWALPMWAGRRRDYYENPKEDALHPAKGVGNLKILAVESSCDETAVAIVRGRAGGLDGLHRVSGGDLHQHLWRRGAGDRVPEAHRGHLRFGRCRRWTRTGLLHDSDIDAVAVTYAPGLIGAVLVGVNFAKAAALALGKPLIPVHHIRGHIAANYLAYPGAGTAVSVPGGVRRPHA